jgi:predicted nucleic acid-binding protein
MTVLIDTNVVLDVSLAREPHFKDLVKVLEMIEIGDEKGILLLIALQRLLIFLDQSIKISSPTEFIKELNATP